MIWKWHMGPLLFSLAHVLFYIIEVGRQSGLPCKPTNNRAAMKRPWLHFRGTRTSSIFISSHWSWPRKPWPIWEIWMWDGLLQPSVSGGVGCSSVSLRLQKHSHNLYLKMQESALPHRYSLRARWGQLHDGGSVCLPWLLFSWGYKSNVPPEISI